MKKKLKRVAASRQGRGKMTSRQDHQRKSKLSQPAAKLSTLGRAKRRVGARGDKNRGSVPVDALIFLKSDHRGVEKLFNSYEKCGKRAFQTKRKLVGRMVRELSQHAAVEEQFFYPAVLREAPESVGQVLEAMEEHHAVKWVLSELNQMEASDERFDAKVALLVESVRRHVYEEEHVLFPEVRAAMGRKALRDLGRKLKEGKNLAPIRPHPQAEEELPGNMIIGAIAGAVDRPWSEVRPR
jgi:hemerythrin superfamily protein